MKLVTKQIEKAFEGCPLYSTDGKKEKKVLAKYFIGNFTWYVFEAEKRGTDYLFYGLVEGFEKELGYFSLSDLEGITARGMKVERDVYFNGKYINGKIVEL